MTQEGLVQKVITKKIKISTNDQVELIIEKAQQNGYSVAEIELWHSAINGKTQHYQTPVRTFTTLTGKTTDWKNRLRKALTSHGTFDGSSIPGFQKIQESDLILKPVLSSAFFDPTTPSRRKKLIVMCDVYDPVHKVSYAKDPRIVAQKAVEFMKNQTYEVDGQQAKVEQIMTGPEIEFFLVRGMPHTVDNHKISLEIVSDEAAWSSNEPGPMPKFGPKTGYFPRFAATDMETTRSMIAEKLEECGIEVEAHHHEVAAAQCEIDMKYAPLVQMGDWQHIYRYLVRTIAEQNGYNATFLPKLMPNDNGSGMHIHFSAWGRMDNGENQNLFAGTEYGGMSKMALYSIGGIIKHWNLISAFAAPTKSADVRFQPGFEAPVFGVHSARNRSAGIRIPVSEDSQDSKRFELRLADPTASVHLLGSVMILAAHDGIVNKIEPPNALEDDVYDLPEHERTALKAVPKFEERMKALHENREFLTSTGVFTNEFIDSFIEYAMQYVKTCDSMMDPRPIIAYQDFV